MGQLRTAHYGAAFSPDGSKAVFVTADRGLLGNFTYSLYGEPGDILNTRYTKLVHQRYAKVLLPFSIFCNADLFPQQPGTNITKVSLQWLEFSNTKKLKPLAFPNNSLSEVYMGSAWVNNEFVAVFANRCQNETNNLRFSFDTGKSTIVRF